MTTRKKRRLDEIAGEVSGVDSLQHARALIMAGKVSVDGRVVSTVGTMVATNQEVRVDTERKYVGRGAYKLLSALERFTITIRNAICADVGSSTGGFTDVLLRSGAGKVYCIDSARGELDWSLRNDKRVEVMEGTPVQRIDMLPEPVDLVVIDVSLLSLRAVIPIVSRWLAFDGSIIALVKPQYEAREDQLPPGAVIRDHAIHADILRTLLPELCVDSLQPRGLVAAKITGGSGNQEFLVWLQNLEKEGPPCEELVRSAISELSVEFE